MGVGSHWRAGRVKWGHGLLFGITGLGGSYIGTAANQAGDPDVLLLACLLYTSPSPRDRTSSRMPASA